MKQTTIEETSAGGVVYRLTGVGTNHKFSARIASQNDAGGSNSQIKYEFLIGKHSGYHKWVLPKGLVEKDESYSECAVREVFEEVGVRTKVADPRPIKTVEYYYMADLEEVINKNPHTKDTSRRVKKYQEEGGVKVRVHKQVHFYLLELVEDSGVHGWEMEEREWVSFAEAKERLAFESEKGVLEAANKALV